MDHTHSPILLPAAALAAGSFLAFHLSFLPLPLLALLALLGLALGGRVGFTLAALGAGALAATVAHGLPDRTADLVDRERPVEVVARVSGHWTADDEGWSAPADLLHLRQGTWTAAPRIEVLLHLPGEEEPPPFGSRLRVKGYLRRSAGFANRAPVPPGPWRLRAKSRALVAVEAVPGPLAALSGRLRRRVEEGLANTGPDTPGTALARALVLGDASRLPLAWRRGLRITGLSHLLSVSGVHVALVAGLVFALTGRLPRRLRLLLGLAAIGLYLLLVGPLPALVRAAVMGLLASLALLAERPPASANALGWAVVLLVLQDPGVVLLPAFQLSISATAGLLLLGPAFLASWTARWPGLPLWLGRPLALSAGAQLASMPWSLPLFHTAALLAPLTNLLAVPWTGLALTAALAWTALATAAPGLAAPLTPALDLLAAPFGWPAATGPGPWLGLPLLAPPLAAWLLAAGAAALLLRPRRAWLWAAGPRERGLELAMLDVGQGDALLLRDGRRAALIDGGGWPDGDLGGRVLLPALLAEGVRRLDALVLTHPDRDHCRGLVDVAAYLPVREVWTGPGWDPLGCAGELVTLPGVKLRVLWAGEEAALGRWRLAVLHPEPDERRGSNERSLVLRAEAAGRRLLLTGDAEAWAERRLLAQGPDALRADLLKVAHHGSAGSSGESFLDAVAPRLALVSAGVNNVYRHPSPAVLARLAGRRVQVLRTDRDGMVLVSFGAGKRMWITLPGPARW